MEKIMLTDIEAAEMLGIGRSTFWRDVAPKIPAVKMSARATRFDVSDVRAYAAAKRAESTVAYQLERKED